MLMLSPQGFAGEIRLARGALCPVMSPLAVSRGSGGRATTVKLKAAGGRYIVMVLGPASGGAYSLMVSDDAPVGLTEASSSAVISGQTLTVGKIDAAPDRNYEVNDRRLLMQRQVENRRAELARIAEQKRRAEEQARLERERQRLEAQAREEERRYAEANRPDNTALIANAFIGAINDAAADQRRQNIANQQLNRRLADIRRQIAAKQAEQRAASEASEARRQAQQASTGQERRQAIAAQASANARAEQARAAQAQARTPQSEQQANFEVGRSFVPAVPQEAGAARGNGGTQLVQRPAATTAPPKRSYPAVMEAISGCAPRAKGRYICFTSGDSMGAIIGPDQASGWRTPEEWVAFVGNCSRRSPAIPLTGGAVAWACGYGLSGITRIDVAQKLGGYVQGRATFYCDPQENYCRRRTPTADR
ncbi:hypothetical protein O4H52_07530 [Sphingomonadaceae bacterium G21617-S1]|nr:hypothetical protein [Sphingomonadaceae bacterium G21617-S1]